MGICVVRLTKSFKTKYDTPLGYNIYTLLCTVILKPNIMNREKAQEILKAYGRPTFKVGDTNVIFARQTDENLNEIESKSDEELIEHWKSLVWLNEIYGQVSLNEMQRISLIELEMEDRKIPSEPLKYWYEDESSKFDEQDFYGV